MTDPLPLSEALRARPVAEGLDVERLAHAYHVTCVTTQWPAVMYPPEAFWRIFAREYAALAPDTPEEER